jgi:hypothetical protein
MPNPASAYQRRTLGAEAQRERAQRGITASTPQAEVQQRDAIAAPTHGGAVHQPGNLATPSYHAQPLGCAGTRPPGAKYLQGGEHRTTFNPCPTTAALLGPDPPPPQTAAPTPIIPHHHPTKTWWGGNRGTSSKGSQAMAQTDP